MSNDKQKFFYKGQYFENEEDFWKAVRDWHINFVNEQDWDDFFKDLRKTITLNLEIQQKQ